MRGYKQGRHVSVGVLLGSMEPAIVHYSAREIRLSFVEDQTQIAFMIQALWVNTILSRKNVTAVI